MRGHNNNINHSSSASKLSKGPPQKVPMKDTRGNNNNNESTITLPRNSKDASGLQDTIYLCNFRVSVDGEWLCLKELQDGVQNQNEGAPPPPPSIEESQNIVSNDKCNEKIVERDWVNYYCRCFFSLSLFLSFILIYQIYSFTQTHRYTFLIYD
jgi:hypothetical protein